MTEKNILEDAFRESNDRNISIMKTGNKKRIIARFEECDTRGILLVLKKDQTKVVNSFRKAEIKTFIPWHQITDVKFL